MDCFKSALTILYSKKTVKELKGRKKAVKNTDFVSLSSKLCRFYPTESVQRMSNGAENKCGYLLEFAVFGYKRIQQ